MPKSCRYCGKPVQDREYCSDYHASAYRKSKKKRLLVARLGRRCQECGSTENLYVSVKDQTVRCGRHHIENSLRKFNQRFPSKNPAKMASILGKEAKLSRNWERNI